MLISAEEEQISTPLENGVKSPKSTPSGSNLESPDSMLSASEIPESPPVPAISTDVKVVPEHENDELVKRISNLEGRTLLVVCFLCLCYLFSLCLKAENS
ncbi:hypothetical protein NMG60_11020630 [Bertholletia excelsa]